MSALLLGAGWKVLAGIGAALALFVAWGVAMMRAKAGGVAQQQAAEIKQREVELEQATIASGTVSSLDDDAVNRELHAAYDRKPVRMGEGDHGRS